MDSDKILVLDKGQVAEFDTPQHLLENKNSIFYSMAKEAGQTE
jgi:ABC-type multidrug transport system fused ATPase/permease subunit